MSTVDDAAAVDGGDRTARLVVRASVVSMAFVAAGSLLGLVRDLLIASVFGATPATDAFLVAWSVPETASPLLVEGAMALVLVPVFSRALTHDSADQAREALRTTIERTAPVTLVTLVALSGLVAVGAPLLVRVLAPGLADPDLATACTRIVAVSVLLLGLTGYASALLRSRGTFGPPAAITVAFNAALVLTVLVGADRLGVRSAALGVSIGTAAMALLLLPLLRRVPRPRLRATSPDAALLGFLPVGLYALARQAQVYVERFFGSSLPAGTITHLNYAQKIGQTPTTLSLLIATVSFPLLARAVARGRAADTRARLLGDLRMIVGLVLLATIFLLVFTPEVVDVIFLRGRFTPDDAAATAAILRVYVLGLAGQATVDVLCRAYFSRAPASWFPALVMAGGLVLTALLSAVLAPRWGAPGIAVSNAVGISATALVLLRARELRAPGPPRLPRLGSVVTALSPIAAALAVSLSVRHAVVAPDVVVLVVGGLGAVAAYVAALAVSGQLRVSRRTS